MCSQHQFALYPDFFATQRSFYTFTPDAYVYTNKAGAVTNHPTSLPGIVDSGTTLLYVPTKVFNGYVASFDTPPAYYEGYPFVPCDTVPPPFGLKIAGTVFNVSAADLILPDSGYVNATSKVEYCIIGVQDAGAGAESLPIFGDVFMKNVVVVFDIGNSTMQFAAHNY